MVWFLLGIIVGFSITWFASYLDKRVIAWDIVRYSQLRDEEWKFIEDHESDRSFWTHREEEEHDAILDRIQDSRDELTKWVQKVLHNDEVSV